MGQKYKVIASSNFGDESFAESEVVAPILTEMQADAICEILNAEVGVNSSAYYVPRRADYVLWGGMAEFV